MPDVPLQNIFFTLLFGGEVAAKMYALHPERFLLSAWYQFDYLITLVRMFVFLIAFVLPFLDRICYCWRCLYTVPPSLPPFLTTTTTDTTTIIATTTAMTVTNTTTTTTKSTTTTTTTMTTTTTTTTDAAAAAAAALLLLHCLYFYYDYDYYV